jgi:hypothetical protein
MRQLVALAVLSCGVARAEPRFDSTTVWQRWFPLSRTARLVSIARIPLKPGPRLVAIAGDDAIVDDGASIARAHAGKLAPVPPGRGKLGTIAWTRPGAVVGLDARGGWVADVPGNSYHVPNRFGPVVAVAGALWFTVNVSLIRLDGSGATSFATGAGQDYEGALAADGDKVALADRDAVWEWDPAAGAQVTVGRNIYWPLDIAAHDHRLLVDEHGHGATVIDGSNQVDLVDSRAAPTSALGWLGDSAIVVGSLDAVTSDGSAIGSYSDGADVLLCWRRELADGHARPHALYRTSQGAQICAMKASGRTIAWIEAGRDADGCDAGPRALVTATLTGECE